SVGRQAKCPLRKAKAGILFWRRPTDSFAPDHSPSRAFPSTSPLPRGDVLFRQAAFRRAVLRVGRRNENARWIKPPGILFWRRPTLARPIAVLPSGLQRFTAVFGMGTGGATALLSPEGW